MKILIVIVLMLCQSAFAQSDGVIADCKMGAELNKGWAAYMDKKLQAIKLIKDAATWDIAYKKLMNEHEDHKDGLISKVQKTMDSKIKNGEFSRIEVANMLVMLEATADSAMAFALTNFEKDNLNKSENYYFRMTYTDCLRSFR